MENVLWAHSAPGRLEHAQRDLGLHQLNLEGQAAQPECGDSRVGQRVLEIVWCEVSQGSARSAGPPPPVIVLGSTQVRRDIKRIAASPAPLPVESHGPAQ